MIAPSASILSFENRSMFFAGLVIIAVLAVGWYWPRLGDSLFLPLEKLGVRMARRKTLVVLGIAVGAIVVRLSLMGLMPLPVPDTHDEFSYLLAGDTFAHGRLTNPPHPLSIFFDTIHVLQHPTYQSVYPPGQGVVLALGQLLGHPWIGVLLSMALMCAAITWMLQQWLPPQWALLGGILVVLRIHLFSYWLETYWGGAVAAIGGALVSGTLPRIFRQYRVRDAFILGVGAALLANSRPLEGLIFLIPVAAVLIGWLFSRRSPPLRTTAARIVIPLLCVFLVAAGFTGYYNWRVTGDSMLLPRALYQRERLNFHMFVWQSPSPPLRYANPQFEEFYNHVTRREYSLSWTRLLLKKMSGFQFFSGSVLWIPLLALPWVVRDRRTRFLLIQFCWCLAGLLCVVYFYPHYAAPLTPCFFALLMQSMRHMRQWLIRGRPVGVFLTRLVVLLVLARVAVYFGHPPLMQEPWAFSRARVVKQLEATPGEHVILVRYAPGHNAHNEWVYNAADIDHAKTVWAREIPGVDMSPLFEYFRGRTIWLLEADRQPLQLRPYEPAAPAEALKPSP